MVQWSDVHGDYLDGSNFGGIPTPPLSTSLRGPMSCDIAMETLRRRSQDEDVDHLGVVITDEVQPEERHSLDSGRTRDRPPSTLLMYLSLVTKGVDGRRIILYVHNIDEAFDEAMTHEVRMSILIEKVFYVFLIKYSFSCLSVLCSVIFGYIFGHCL